MFFAYSPGFYKCPLIGAMRSNSNSDTVYWFTYSFPLQQKVSTEHNVRSLSVGYTSTG